MVGEILLHQLCCLSMDFTSVDRLLFSPGSLFTHRKIHRPRGTTIITSAFSSSFMALVTLLVIRFCLVWFGLYAYT